MCEGNISILAMMRFVSDLQMYTGTNPVPADECESIMIDVRLEYLQRSLVNHSVL